MLFISVEYPVNFNDLNEIHKKNGVLFNSRRPKHAGFIFCPAQPKDTGENQKGSAQKSSLFFRPRCRACPAIPLWYRPDHQTCKAAVNIHTLQQPVVLARPCAAVITAQRTINLANPWFALGKSEAYNCFNGGFCTRLCQQRAAEDLSI